MRVFFFLFLFLFSASSCLSSWKIDITMSALNENTRKEIIIDTSSLTQSLTNFPLLVEIQSDADIGCFR